MIGSLSILFQSLSSSSVESHSPVPLTGVSNPPLAFESCRLHSVRRTNSRRSQRDQSPHRQHPMIGSSPANRFAKTWCRSCYTSSPGKVPCKALYSSYRRACDQQNVPQLGPIAFDELLRVCFPGIQVKRGRARGKAAYHYHGISPSTEADAIWLVNLTRRDASPTTNSGNPASSSKDKPQSQASSVAAPKGTPSQSALPLKVQDPITPHLTPHLSSIEADAIDMPRPHSPITGGGFGDIFIGTHISTGTKVAMKRLRFKTDDDAARRIRREAAHWSSFDHDNILRFLGIMEVRKWIYLISPWMERGNLSRFTENRLRHLDEGAPSDSSNPAHAYYDSFDESVAIRQVAAGIAYLHSCGFVHGDLKCFNILLAEDGRAVLCDFGLTKALGSNTSGPMKGVGSLRWQSPELLDNCEKTMSSDVYAFAMVIFEILTGEYPFSHLSEVAFINAVVNKHERPTCPPSRRLNVDFEPLWDVAKRCWQTLPQDRPLIDAVLQELEGV